MASNYLEQLIAEWYEYQNYVVRRNVRVGKRKTGGYECELDIVAFHAGKPHLIHLEPSMDADSWATREKRFSRKFAAGRRYIPDLFPGFRLPKKLEQVAVFAVGSKKNRQTLAGGKILLVRELIEEIFTNLLDKSVMSEAVPEQFPLLRTLQFVGEYRDVVRRVWEGGGQ